MSAGRRFRALILPLLLSGCAAQRPPLATIERIPGSTTHEGAASADSSHTIHRLQGSGSATGGTIRPLHDSGAAASATAGEIVPLRDTANVVPLDGTTWNSSNYEGSLTLEFLVGGILRYTTPAGTWTNGTWEQHANTVTFEMNSHFADYSGHIRGGRMSGTARNRTGRTWDWEATRQ